MLTPTPDSQDEDDV
jgi:hypothetical protein